MLAVGVGWGGLTWQRPRRQRSCGAASRPRFVQRTGLRSRQHHPMAPPADLPPCLLPNPLHPIPLPGPHCHSRSPWRCPTTGHNNVSHSGTVCLDSVGPASLPESTSCALPQLGSAKNVPLHARCKCVACAAHMQMVEMRVSEQLWVWVWVWVLGGGLPPVQGLAPPPSSPSAARRSRHTVSGSRSSAGEASLLLGCPSEDMAAGCPDRLPGTGRELSVWPTAVGWPLITPVPPRMAMEVHCSMQRMSQCQRDSGAWTCRHLFSCWRAEAACPDIMAGGLVRPLMQGGRG